MDLMSLSARDLSNKCLEAFRQCLTFRSADPGLSNQRGFYDERFEYRLADFNLWIDGIGALAPSKASLDSRLNERQIDLSLVKGNLIILFQSLEDCLNLLKDNESLKDALLDIDSALESLVTLSLAIRRTGRRSRLHKADRLFEQGEHAELRKHLEAIILLRPGPGPCYRGDEFRKKMELTTLQSHLVTANLKRRNRFIQAHLHSLGLKKRAVGFELPTPETVEKTTASAPSPEDMMREIMMPMSAPTPQPPNRPLAAPMSVTSASVPESKLDYKEPISKRTESTPMTVITQITASARYPRPNVSDNEQKVVQCPCCCQTLPVSEAKNNNRWRKHLAEDIRPYTCIFDRCPAPDVYFSSRTMLEQHFRQDHPPVWVCPLCDRGSVYSTMTEMMDHLHNTHAHDIGEHMSSIISSSAQTKMGIENCPLCEVKGSADSPELIDHVLEHVHDFSLRSLPWPKSSEVDLGGEVGSFNRESDEAFSVTQWLEGYEHETEDIDPTLKLSTCDYGRLAIITEQIESQKVDKLGLDIGFADEHGDESAEAETDISQLTQDTLSSVKESERDRDVVFCHECSAEWYRDENGLTCPKCQSELVEIIEPENDPRDLTLRKTPTGPRLSRTDLLSGLGKDGRHLMDAPASKPSTRESTFGFRRFADRLFSRKNTDHIGKTIPNIFARFPALSFQACSILVEVYWRSLHSSIKRRSAFTNFLKSTQGEDVSSTNRSVSDLDSFLHIMLTFYMAPLKALPPKDLTKPISKYFIKSSHRTIQRGTSPNSHPSSRSIREALYAGYRCIDIEVWDGDDDSMTEAQVDPDVLYQPSSAKGGSITKKLYRSSSPAREITAPKYGAPKITLSKSDRSTSLAEPIVKDSGTLTGHFSFREACEVIKSSAFSHSDLPVIVNMSVYAGPEQQELMVRIIKEEWNDCLVDEPHEGCDPRFRLPKLADLRNRILVRFPATRVSDILDSDSFVKISRREGLDYKDYIPIIQPLDELAIYMRSKPFEGFDNIGAKDPAHVFSLQEDGLRLLMSVPTDDISMENLAQNQLFRHNRDFFFHVTPKSARADSSNLEPLQFWKHGVQMAAINRHNIDEGMMLNEGLFADESGWVLKPDRLFIPTKGVPFGLPIHSSLVEVSICIFQGQAFDLISKDGIRQDTGDLSPLTMATIHISGDSDHRLSAGDNLVKDEESGDFCYKHKFAPAKAITNIVLKLCILRLQFADYSSGQGLIAWTSLRLDRLNQGYRLVQLYNEKGGLLSKEKMLIKFNIKLQE